MHAPRRRLFTRALVRLLPITLVALAFGVVESPPAVAGPENYHIEGGGFGHGVGMSQYGSRGMADAGFGYADILRHYYSGASVGRGGGFSPLRIWLADDTTEPVETNLTAGGNVEFHNNNQLVATMTSGQTARVAVVNGAFEIFVNGNKVAGPVGGAGSNLHVHFENGGGPIRVDKTGYRYRYGVLDLFASTTRLRIVLADLSMQEYLYGLGEVPSSWPSNALKAQVVAARTYAAEKQARLGNNRSDCSCTLWTDVRDQNYTGYEKEVSTGGDLWKAAVDQTPDEVITYNGALIQAFYSSSSGGHTENSENVFFESLPYLRGVPDPHDSTPSNSLHRWSRDISRADLQNWLNTSTSTSVGTLDRIEFVPPFGVSGRVTRYFSNNDQGGVRIIGSGGTKRVSGDTFRGVVNRASGSFTKLPSSLMQIGGWPAYAPGFTGGMFLAAGKLGNTGDPDRIVTGADRGGGPHVRLFEADGTAFTGGFFAYDSRFAGGVRVATCDLFGDGPPYEIVTGPGPGGGPHVRVFGIFGTDVGGFMAYDQRFANGVFVACGDVDPTNPGGEIVTGADAGGGPHVRVFAANGTPLGGGFFAYDSRFPGGVRVAVSSGPNGNRIVTAPGAGGGPHVRTFRNDGSPTGIEFMAYDGRFTGGVFLAAGDVFGGDGRAEIITGPGQFGGPHVRLFGYNQGELLRDYMLTIDGSQGARVAGLVSPTPAIAGAGGPGTRPLVAVQPIS